MIMSMAQSQHSEINPTSSGFRTSITIYTYIKHASPDFNDFIITKRQMQTIFTECMFQQYAYREIWNIYIRISAKV